MIVEACRGKNSLRQFTNGDFFQTFDQPLATLCQVLHRQWLDLFTVISLQGSLLSVCTATSVHPPSYLSCLVSSSSPVTYSIYSHTNYIHTFIHPYIHTSILSYVHIYTHSCVHIIYTTSIHTWLHQSPRVLFGRIPSVQSSIVSIG